MNSEKRKKITYLHQYFNKPDMAGSTRSYEQARRLANAGYDVTVFTTSRSKQGRLFVREEVDGFSVIWCRVPYSNSMGFLQRVFAFLKYSIISIFYVIFTKSSIVYGSSTPLTVAIPGIIASFKPNTKFIFEVRDLWPEIPIELGFLNNPLLILLSRTLEKLAYARADWIIALSPGMADGICRSRGVTDKITVIPNACDIELFEGSPRQSYFLRNMLGLDPDITIVAYCGAFGFVNGVSYLVDLAIASQAFNNVVFVAVGEGKEKPQIVSYAEESGVLGINFFVLDPFPKKTMPLILSDVDIACSFVRDYRVLEANSANKFFDGLAAGCCIALNHGGWQKDLIIARKAGIHLSRDAVTAAAQLQDVLSDPEFIVEAKIASKALATEMFDRDVLTNDLLKVVRQVLNS